MYISPQLADFGIARNPSLPTGEDGGGYRTYSRYEGESSSRVIKPVLILLMGFAALCIGFWRMYFTARRGELRTWAVGAALFLFGWITCVFGGMWFLIGHAPLSFTRAPVHAGTASVFCGSSGVSAPCYRGLEDIGVISIVVPELKFRDVQRHVLGTDLMERADDAPLENAPEALNRLSMDRTDDVLMFGMVNGRVRVVFAERA
jgi:hypothetical protein